MKIDIVTLFEKMVSVPLSGSIVGRARKEGIVKIGFSNPRDFTSDRHKTVDDRPYGGGPGMVMMAEPLYRAVKNVKRRNSTVILFTPGGKLLTQTIVEELARKKHLVLVCGRYEGVDDRISRYVDMELSIGDYILSGGEPAAVVLVDAISRRLPGVLKKKEALKKESFSDYIIEPPQYTRPEKWRGMEVPKILLSGNHKLIEEWRKKKSLEITKCKRPDLLSRCGAGRYYEK